MGKKFPKLHLGLLNKLCFYFVVTNIIICSHIFHCRYLFTAFKWCGTFPIVYNPEKCIFRVSRSGVLISVIYSIVLLKTITEYIYVVITGRIKKSAAVSVLLISSYFIGQLIVITKKIVCKEEMVKNYNNLAKLRVNHFVVPKGIYVVLFINVVFMLAESIGNVILE